MKSTSKKKKPRAKSAKRTTPKSASKKTIGEILNAMSQEHYDAIDIEATAKSAALAVVEMVDKLAEKQNSPEPRDLKAVAIAAYKEEQRIEKEEDKKEWEAGLIILKSIFPEIVEFHSNLVKIGDLTFIVHNDYGRPYLSYGMSNVYDLADLGSLYLELDQETQEILQRDYHSATICGCESPCDEKPSLWERFKTYFTNRRGC